MVKIIRCCGRSHSTGVNKCCDRCDCDERREALRIRQRIYRAKVKEREAKLGKLSAVPDIPAAPAPKSTTVKTQYPLGIIGENAIKEIAKINGAAERNPLLVALIMRLASEIDRGEVAQLSSAANTIKRMMDELRAQSTPAAEAGLSMVREPTPVERFWSDFREAEQRERAE